MAKPDNILDGYKVLDFTQIVAGTTTTRLMAEMGADVIKIEMAPGGDLSRVLPYEKDGRSAYFIQHNIGKRSLCVDLRNPEGAELVKKLIAKVDVVVENFAPGIIDKLGFSYAEVKKINPEVIMCSISAFGQDGPLSKLPGYDYIAQCYAGVTAMIGEADGPPLIPMLAIGDVSTGILALAGVTSALLYKAKTGKGQYLDISLLDAYLNYHELNIEAYSASGGEILPQRSGGHHFNVAPLGIYQGKDSYLFIAALPHQWQLVCNTIGRPELFNDPKFIDNPARIKNLPELISIIEGWLQAFGDDEKARAALEKARVPVAQILTVPQAISHPHAIERGSVRTVNDRQLGKFTLPGMPLRFSEFPNPEIKEAPFLGEHNAEVLADYLGMSKEQVGALEKKGVLKSLAIINNRD